MSVGSRMCLKENVTALKSNLKLITSSLGQLYGVRISCERIKLPVWSFWLIASIFEKWGTFLVFINCYFYLIHCCVIYFLSRPVLFSVRKGVKEVSLISHYCYLGSCCCHAIPCFQHFPVSPLHSCSFSPAHSCSSPHYLLHIASLLPAVCHVVPHCMQYKPRCTSRWSGTLSFLLWIKQHMLYKSA